MSDALRPGTLYFAYGCNMDPEFLAGVVNCRLEPGWPARVEGWRLAFNLADTDAGGSVVASLIEDRSCSAFGVVYRMPQVALAALDAFEEVPRRYRRATLWVEPLGRPARQAALAYLGQSEWLVDEGQPDPVYLEILLRGARLHALPMAYIEWIEALAAGRANPRHSA